MIMLFTDTNRLIRTGVAVVAAPIRERLIKVAAVHEVAIVLFTRPNHERRIPKAQRGGF